ncbi:amidohydrolase [Paenibacillus sp. MDMC362]|uniref:amidohydrolase n=1 Tax=Paenibacillus sp. MDMC362 TaxID=2977365 RepID=UPI000DC3BAEA|nr:amidohydrolase [Paenibacillus sp. MDMC362]RAR44158.1 amidohydrolase [Paenibacillus sp. MDMC362]
MQPVLFTNGNLFLPHSASTADSIYVEDGIIRAIGSAADLRLQLADRKYRTVDWDGAFVLSGLVDAHMHLGMHGLKLGMLDFTEATSKEEMLAMLRERVAVTQPGEWIMGLNWNEHNFPDHRIPSMQELDDITTEHPVYLTRTCFHAYLGNSEAFQRAGVTSDTPDPESGAFGRDADGRLNGRIYENASIPFAMVQPKPDSASLKLAMLEACRDALRLGLTAAHTEDLRLLGSVEAMQRVHRELREEGLHFRTHQLMFHGYLDEMKELGLKPGSGNDWNRIGAVKLFADGAVGGRTALLKEPYHDAPHTRGLSMHTLEELREIVGSARQLGFPVAFHAIGDGAAASMTDVLEFYPLSRDAKLPDRFIHAQIVHPDTVKRMSKLNLAVDLQPRFVASDFPWVLERVGPDRTSYLYAWKKWLRSGLPCSGGSDAPIEPLSPLLGIHAAMTRRKPEEKHDGYLPEEKLSLTEAIELFTLGGAKAAGESGQRGTIAIGKYADFTVVDRCLHDAMDPDELLMTKIRMTIVNGEIGYTQ